MNSTWNKGGCDALNLSVLKNQIETGFINEVVSETNIFVLNCASIVDNRGSWTKLINVANNRAVVW